MPLSGSTRDPSPSRTALRFGMTPLLKEPTSQRTFDDNELTFRFVRKIRIVHFASFAVGFSYYDYQCHTHSEKRRDNARPSTKTASSR